MKYQWIALGLWLVCSVARADLPMMREHVRQMDSGRVAVGADLHGYGGVRGGVRTALVSPAMFLAARWGELVLEGTWAVSYLHERSDAGGRGQRLAIANPYAGFAFLPDTSCGLARLSLGIAYDAARDTPARGARALALARAVRGDWDGILFRDHVLPLVLGAGTLKDLGRLRLQWDADLALGLPAATRTTELLAQTAGEAGLRFRWHTVVSLRASLAYAPTFLGDRFQSAASAQLRHSRPGGDSFGARFVVNFDGPFGLSFAGRGVWGASLFYARSL